MGLWLGRSGENADLIYTFPLMVMRVKMTGKKLLRIIKKERLQLEKLKKEHQEEEKYFQVVHGVNYENVHGSGGRVSTLDDVLERQERERTKYRRRYILAYSSYCDHLLKAWEISALLFGRGIPGVAFMMDYFSNIGTYEETAERLGMNCNYLRELVARATVEFETAYQVEYNNPPL